MFVNALWQMFCDLEPKMASEHQTQACIEKRRCLSLKHGSPSFCFLFAFQQFFYRQRESAQTIFNILQPHQISRDRLRAVFFPAGKWTDSGHPYCFGQRNHRARREVYRLNMYDVQVSLCELAQTNRWHLKRMWHLSIC